MSRQEKHVQRILLLEDDEDLAEGIELSLQSDEIKLTLCSSIAEAEREMENREFDLFLLDINLPDGSGLELCRRIRASGSVPIGILTAKDMEIDIIKGLEYGADDYITKPFSLMVLRARVRALLRRSGRTDKAEYRDDIFHFAFDTMEFYKNGMPGKLSGGQQQRVALADRIIRIEGGRIFGGEGCHA